MKLIDCHSHTAYSGHGSGTVVEAVAQAEALGLATYAQTEHLTLPKDLDPQRGDSMSPQDAESYLRELREQQLRLAQNGSPMRLVAGVEADWLPGRGPELKELCAPYDYVIGSIHFLDGLPLDNDENMTLWEQKGADGVWELYLNSLEELIRNSDAIHCLGHLDLPKVFGQLPSFDVRDALGDLVPLIMAQGLIIEVNTAGWRKPVGQQYPDAPILELFAAAGVPCTVGCDAHKPCQIGSGVEQAYRTMFDAGYRQVCVPTMATAATGAFDFISFD